MIIRNVIKRNSYYDSVNLMLLSSKLSPIPGVDKAAVMMGTDMNKSLMEESGLLMEEGRQATANDMIIAVSARDEEAIARVFEEVDNFIKNKDEKTGSLQEEAAHNLESALSMLPGANLAVISVPGQYAKYEAQKALRNGCHVFLFSDNVGLEEEIELKDFAIEKGLLMMGPDCGTAIINNRAIGFANVVPPGDIGLIAAAGTGLQEVTCLLSQNGFGISQALGTGGRDLKEPVNGRMMLQGFRALAADDNTKVIVLISKPPAQEIAEKVISEAEKVDKPVVICFLGQKIQTECSGVFIVDTLEEAAKKAMALEEKEGVQTGNALDTADIESIARTEIEKMSPEQKYLRGNFSGGTLCYEALLVCQEELGGIYSNAPLNPSLKLPDSSKSISHTCVDLGEDEFTRGRPHPMIEPALRKERILQEANDPETAVLLLDVVLGYGCHHDPAGVLSPSIIEAKEAAAAKGRYLSVVVSVCGTQLDPQNREDQIEKLEKAGAIVMASNAQAARLAALIAKKSREGRCCYEQN
jgi:FdrA protein